MITITSSTKVEFNRKGIKYISKFTNLDKKFIFAREFISGFKMDTHSDKFILEVCTTEAKKSWYVVDMEAKTVTEVKYDDLKKEKNVDPSEFCAKYFR